MGRGGFRRRSLSRRNSSHERADQNQPRHYFIVRLRKNALALGSSLAPGYFQK